MRSTLNALYAAAAVLPLLAGPEAGAQTKTPGQIDMAAPTRITTSEYIQQAAMSDLFEIEAARIAIDKADGKDVKGFAEMMIKDHTASAKMIAEAATRGETGVAVPGELDGEHKAQIALLRNAAGIDFDRLYVNAQLAAHEKALTLHQSYAKTGDNKDLKDAAGTAARTVEDHFAKIKAIQKALAKP